VVGLSRWTFYDEPAPETPENLAVLRLQRLLRGRGREAIYPKPHLSAGRGHKVSPYLLRGVAVERADPVGLAASTSVPLPSGFRYRAAPIDGFSRYVIAWRLSNTREGSFGQDMLEEALGRGRPEVFNPDPGVPFTAGAWTGRLERAGVYGVGAKTA
jgi:putative transposase